MKIINLLAAAAVVASASAAMSTAAYATDSDSATCAAIDPSRGGAARVVTDSTEMSVIVAKGEAITVVLTGGTTIDYNGKSIKSGTATSGVPVVFSVSDSVTFDRPQSDGSTSARYICSAASSSSSTKAPQSTISPVVINSANNAANNAINDAISGAFDPDSSSGAGYVAANGFSLSTRGLTRQAQKNNAEDGFGYNSATSDPWNIWITGRWDIYEGDNNSFDGNVANLSAGFDYKITENILIGILTGVTKSDIDSQLNGNSGSLKSTGYTIGTYVGGKTGSLTSSAFVAYTGSDYDVVNGGNTGSFNADRVTIGLKTYGSVEFSSFTLQPTASITYSSEKQDAYTDSGSNSIAANTIDSGRLSVGPKFIFNPWQLGSGATTPWAAVNLDHDFSSQTVAATTGAPDVGDATSASLEFGINSQLENGSTVTASGRIGGLGSGAYTSYGGSVKLRIPLQ